MGIVEDLAGVDVKALFDELDEIFSESGERRNFMADCQELPDDDLVLLQRVLGQDISRDEMLSQIESVKEPARVVDTILNLVTELEKTNNRLLLELIFELAGKPGVYEKLDPGDESFWEAILLVNPHLTGDQIHFFWERKKKAWLKMIDSYMNYLLSTNPGCPVNVLEDLLDYDDRSVRSAIARHPNISPEIIRIYLNSPRKPDRKALAGNQHVSAEVLMSLMDDKYQDIVKSAKRNFLKRFPADSLTNEAIAVAIEKNVDMPQAKPKKLKKVFDPREVEELGPEYVASLKDPKERKKVAEWTADQQILEALSHDKSVGVRRVVAARFRCADTLKELIKDGDLQTSNMAIKSFAKSFPDCAIEDLLEEPVLNEVYENINYHVNEDSNKDLHDIKLNAKEKAELQRAQLVARHTKNEMIQNRILHRLSDDTWIYTIRGQLRSALVDNPHLCESVIRKLVLELKHGVWRVLENCRDPALLDALIADERLGQSSRKVAIRTRDKLLENQ